MQNTEILPDSSQDKFKSWAFLELMGHRKLAGLVQEVEIASSKLLRIDVPTPEGKTITQFYSPGAVYCITPTTEEMVRAYANSNRAEPVHRYELEFKEETSADPSDLEPDPNNC
jgi:hypothetical protein